MLMTIKQINYLVKLLQVNSTVLVYQNAYPGIGVSGDKTAPGVTKNKPNSFWDQTRYPTMTTKVGFQANLDYNIPQYEVDFKPNNASREQIVMVLEIWNIRSVKIDITTKDLLT